MKMFINQNIKLNNGGTILVLKVIILTTLLNNAPKKSANSKIPPPSNDTTPSKSVDIPVSITEIIIVDTTLIADIDIKARALLIFNHAPL